MLQLARYITALPGKDWIEAGRHSQTDPQRTLYDYIFATNGVFIRCQREALDACIPIANCEIRGLATVEPFINLAYPPVPANYLNKILEISRADCIENGTPIEALFHLRWLEDKQRWRLDKPRQIATNISVRPVDDDADSSYGQALIEVHSHHIMDGRFSEIDDLEEQGFRIYGVIGDIFNRAHLRLRIGCYGNFYEIPANDVFELPRGLKGCEPETEL